jgi:predicted nucleic acid-binding protein
MKVLLDLNVLLDVVLAREPFASDSMAVFRACADGRAVGYVSAISIPTLFYIGRRTVGTDLAFLAIDRCLRSFEICPVDRAILQAARALSGSDFEDDIQAACASMAGLDVIVTRDRTGFGNAPIPVLSPAELVARLPAP